MLLGCLILPLGVVKEKPPMMGALTTEEPEKGTLLIVRLVQDQSFAEELENLKVKLKLVMIEGFSM